MWNLEMDHTLFAADPDHRAAYVLKESNAYVGDLCMTDQIPIQPDISRIDCPKVLLSAGKVNIHRQKV